MMYGIFGGRFQPFHKGHLEALKIIKKQVDEVIIGITVVPEIFSSDELKGTTLFPAKNPFTFLERYEMINATIKNVENLRNIKILPLLPYLSAGSFLSLTRSYLPKNPKERCWFVALKGEEERKQVESFYNKLGEEIRILQLPENLKKYSSKEIRKRIVFDKNWEELVPKPVVNIIKRIDGIKRLKKLYNEHGEAVFSDDLTKIIDFEQMLKNKILNSKT